MSQSNGTLPHPEPPQKMTIDGRRADFHEVLPVDRSQPFYPEMYPRDPDAYEPLDHFYQRQKEEERLLEREIQGFSAVRKTIYAGELRDNSDGCGVFVYDHDGIEFYVVVGYHLKGYRIAVTGWPILRDEDEAISSGTWRRGEVEMVREFNEEYLEHKQSGGYDRPYYNP